MGEKAKLGFSHDNQVARLILSAPKANILDQGMVTDLCEALASIEDRRDLRAIVIDAEGPHFSFGASVEEQLPGEIGPARGEGVLHPQRLELPG